MPNEKNHIHHNNVISLLSSDEDEDEYIREENEPPAAKGATPIEHHHVAFGHGQYDDGIFTHGILYSLEKYIMDLNSKNKNTMTRCDIHTIPLSSSLVHIQQRDSYSCGYRNIQQVLSSLLHILPSNHILFTRLGIPCPSTHTHSYTLVTIPTITQLQAAIEMSWNHGYDIQGAKHYNYKLCGSKAFIGAIEFATLLHFLQLHVQVVQFITCEESRNQLGPFLYFYFATSTSSSVKNTTTTTPTSKKRKMNYNVMKDCTLCSSTSSSSSATAPAIMNRIIHALQYASSMNTTTTMPTATVSMKSSLGSSSSSCCCTCTYPIYLQWEGHSITVVGIEKCIHSYNLLVLDPAKPYVSSSTTTSMRNHYSNTHPLPFSFPIHRLKDKDIQIIITSTHDIPGKDKIQRKEVQVITAQEDKVVTAMKKRL